MVLHSARWLALSYFTYFFSFGVFLPFWAVWLDGEGILPESIGILIGTGLVARFLGSLLLTPSVSNPSHLINAIRLLALLSLVCTIGFIFGNAWAWLLLVIAGFNFFFSPIMPLSDALAGIWQKQFPLNYGDVRLWGSLAFIVGTLVTGQMINVFGHQAILGTLLFGLVVMLLGMLPRPSVMPGKKYQHGEIAATPWVPLLTECNVWRFMLCVTLLQTAHAAYYSFSAIYWQNVGYSAAAVSYLWSVSVVAEILVFAFNYYLFRHWSVRNLLLLSTLCGVIRWSILASSTALPWLIAAQLLHCGTFGVCHLAAMRFISSRISADVIRLQAVYNAFSTGAGIAIMTVITGSLFEKYQGQVFWLMLLVTLPALLLLVGSPTKSAINKNANKNNGKKEG